MEFNVNLTPWLMQPRGKCPWYLMDGRVGGPQNRNESGDRKSVFLPEIELRSFSPYYLSYPGYVNAVYLRQWTLSSLSST
jgi:hypothetical protein